MSTSEPRSALRGTITAAAIAATLATVLSPADPAMVDLPVHPAWIVALILAARYGARGLYAVPSVIVGVQLAAWLAGTGDIAMLERLLMPGELALLATIAVITIVGAMHESRKARLETQLREAEKRASAAEAAVSELSETSIALRDRCDRSQTSLAFVADLATRMDGQDPSGAGDAALALAMARTGARGGFVQLLDNGRLRTLASRGMWSADRLAPPAVFRDVVATTALERKAPVAAHEVAAASSEDSDLAAPLLDASGAPIGVLALRGISYPALTSAAREDLAAVARWAGRSFVLPPQRTAGPAVRPSRGDIRALT